MKPTKNNKRGAINPAMIMITIVALAFSAILISSLYPSSMDTLYEEDTSDWGYGVYNETSGLWESGGEDTQGTRIWEVYPLLYLIAGALVVIGIAIKVIEG